MTLSNKPTILFMGTPAFALESLKALHLGGYPLVGVVTQPDTVAGRGLKETSCACAVYARENKLRLFQPPSIKDTKTIEELKELAPDFIVVAAYGQFLPDTILQIPKIDIVNVHGSLLPAYRGAAPIQYALLNGDTTTGVSIMRVIKKMDAGPVYSQATLPIEITDTSEGLMAKAATVGADLLTKTIPQIIDGLKPVEQDESKVSFSPSIKKAEGKIDWTKTSHELDCLVRAFYPWPIAHTSIQGKILKVFEASPVQNNASGVAGTLVSLESDGIVLKTNAGCLLLKTVQLEGKKKMNAAECARGLRLNPGDKFE
ncbi:methionyl-tRNA formyltransferase [bacterium]|nr:methionyl-tRNA formyltransferase [bacterium]